MPHHHEIMAGFERTGDRWDIIEWTYGLERRGPAFIPEKGLRKYLSGLNRSFFPAVPDERRLHSVARGDPRYAAHIRKAFRRKALLGVNLLRQAFPMLYEE